MYQREELEKLIQNYQAKDNLYEVKKLNNEEAENILITHDTIFLGTNKMQLKKLDGTIEKYNIERYYPIDEKDESMKQKYMNVSNTLFELFMVEHNNIVEMFKKED